MPQDEGGIDGVGSRLEGVSSQSHGGDRGHALVTLAYCPTPPPTVNRRRGIRKVNRARQVFLFLLFLNHKKQQRECIALGRKRH